MRAVLLACSASSALLVSCVGELRSTEPDGGLARMDAATVRADGAPADDARVTPGEDALVADAHVTPGEDAWAAAIDAYVGVDAYVGADAYVASDAYVARDAYAASDAYVARDAYARDAYARDAYVAPDPTCTTGTPLAAPIAGCMPTVPPSTGDPHADCVARINQFRCECQHLPPLTRWTAGEACADMMAQYDHEHPTMAHAGFAAGICSGGYGQNECPGWPSVASTVNGCLQQMWDEGPGDFYGPPPHGHYINMSSTSFTRVACGFYSGSRGVYAVQNFQ